MSRYIVMSASACMPGSCWGRYRRVAVVELDDGFQGEPKFIGEHARGVRRVVRVWERCNQGVAFPHARCAASYAWREATGLAERLNAGGEA